VTTLSVPPSGSTAARLQRRSQAVARLRHPNLVRILPLPGGAGLSPVLGNAHRLADFTLPRGTFKRFDLEQVVRLLIDVLSGLTALHEVVSDGVPFVHGLVSPQHIYIDEHGTARLVPLLPAHFSANAKVERTGYVAPERLLGQPLDARTDVFSIGVMLWEALSGTRLCPDGTIETLPAAGQRPPPIQLAPRLKWAQPLCAIAERAVAFEPAQRFANAHELSLAIAEAVGEQLSRDEGDGWQDEAPTPVFQPRLHLAKLRTSTPPPAVLTVATAPAAVAAPLEQEPSVATPASLEPSAVEAAREPVVARRGRGGWGFAAALGLLLAGGAVFRFMPTHTGEFARRFMAPPPAAAAAAWVHLAPAATAPPAGALSPAPSGVASATSPVASAAVVASASAVPSAASAPSRHKLPGVSGSPKPRTRSEDYGF
jgi:serine/threonine-protein kinase